MGIEPPGEVAESLRIHRHGLLDEHAGHRPVDLNLRAILRPLGRRAGRRDQDGGRPNMVGLHDDRETVPLLLMADNPPQIRIPTPGGEASVDSLNTFVEAVQGVVGTLTIVSEALGGCDA